MFILKQLRRKKKISQTELAKIIGVSLRTIQLYEKKGANIPIKNLTKIAQYFDISIAELYTQEKVNEQGAIYKHIDSQKDKEHTIIKLGPGKYLISVPLLLSGNYSDFTYKYEDPSYLESLPKISFVVEQVSVGKYLAFEISNDSMDNGTTAGIPNKSIVLGKLTPVNKLATMVRDNPKTLWVINHHNSIMCKKITAFNKKNKTLKCHSLNISPEYSDFEIHMGEVRQFYRIIKRQIE